MLYRGTFVLLLFLLVSSFSLQHCDCGGVGRDNENALADGQVGADRSSTGGAETTSGADQSERTPGTENSTSNEPSKTENSSSVEPSPSSDGGGNEIGPELPQPDGFLPAQPWFMTAGSNRNDFGMTIATRPGGGVYIGGSFGTSATWDKYSTQGEHLTVAVVDHRGKIERAVIWKAGGDEARLGMRAVLSDSNDNLYILAVFRGAVALSNTLTLTGKGKAQLLLAKYDAKGTLLWRSVATNTVSWVEADSLVLGPDGDVYLAGHCEESLDWEGTALAPAVKGNRLFVARIQASSGKPLWLKGNAVGAFGSESTMAPKVGVLNSSLFVLTRTQLQSAPFVPAWTKDKPFSQPGTHVLVLDKQGTFLRMQTLATSEAMMPTDMVMDAANQRWYVSADAPGPVSIKGTNYKRSSSLQRTFIWEMQEKGSSQPATIGWVQQVEGLGQSLFEARSLGLALRKGGGLYAVGSFSRGTLALGPTLKLKTDRSVATVVAVISAQGVWSKALSIQGNTVEARGVTSQGDYLFLVGRYARSLDWKGVEYPSRGDYDIFAMGLLY